MTSPISLLTLLGGTAAEPVATTQPQVDDAALFAAALVSALQQLQPPVKLVQPAPVAPEAEVADPEVPDEQVPEEGVETQTRSANASATLGQLLDAKVGESDETGVVVDREEIGVAKPAPAPIQKPPEA